MIATTPTQVTATYNTDDGTLTLAWGPMTATVDADFSPYLQPLVMLGVQINLRMAANSVDPTDMNAVVESINSASFDMPS